MSDEEYNSIFPNQKNLLEYEVLYNNDRDVVIESILRKINMKNLRISGDNNNNIWEKGWGEILESIGDDFTPDKIMPQYFDHHNIMRLDGNYIKALTENFVYKYDQIIRKVILKKYAGSKSNLVELGCGTGSGTLLAATDLDKSISITASDWASTSLPIIKKISEFTGRDIAAKQFNMLDMNYFSIRIWS